MFLEPVVPSESDSATSRSRRTEVALRSTLFPDTPRSPYAPGPVRHDTDAQHAAVCAFCRDNPEFATQPADVVSQYMDRRSGFRTEAELAERQLLEDEGVPVAAPARWSDEA
jgi:hypothetical protein